MPIAKGPCSHCLFHETIGHLVYLHNPGFSQGNINHSELSVRGNLKWVIGCISNRIKQPNKGNGATHNSATAGSRYHHWEGKDNGEKGCDWSPWPRAFWWDLELRVRHCSVEAGDIQSAVTTGVTEEAGVWLRGEIS